MYIIKGTIIGIVLSVTTLDIFTRKDYKKEIKKEAEKSNGEFLIYSEKVINETFDQLYHMNTTSDYYNTIYGNTNHLDRIIHDTVVIIPRILKKNIKKKLNVNPKEFIKELCNRRYEETAK